MSMFHGNKVPEVNAVDAESGQTGHILLDVRNSDEWEAGHAPSAQWVPSIFRMRKLSLASLALT